MNSPLEVLHTKLNLLVHIPIFKFLRIWEAGEARHIIQDHIYLDSWTSVIDLFHILILFYLTLINWGYKCSSPTNLVNVTESVQFVITFLALSVSPPFVYNALTYDHSSCLFSILSLFYYYWIHRCFRAYLYFLLLSKFSEIWGESAIPSFDVIPSSSIAFYISHNMMQ